MFQVQMTFKTGMRQTNKKKRRKKEKTKSTGIPQFGEEKQRDWSCTKSQWWCMRWMQNSFKAHNNGTRGYTMKLAGKY